MPFGVGSTANANPVSHNYNEARSFDILLTVTSDHGCIAKDSLLSYINVTPIPVTLFSLTPEITDVSHTVVEFTNGSIDADY